MEAVQKEAEYRENRKVVDLEYYNYVRRGNSGVLAYFTLFEPALGVDLPDGVVEHPAFKDILTIGMDLICWSNVSYIGRTVFNALIRAGYRIASGFVQFQHGAITGD